MSYSLHKKNDFQHFSTARVTHQFPEDPLLSLPYLSPNLRLHYTNLRKKRLDISRSILMFSYGPKKRVYSSWFSRIMRRHLLQWRRARYFWHDYFSDTYPCCRTRPMGEHPNPIHLALCQSRRIYQSKFTKELWAESSSYWSDVFCELRRTEDYTSSI